MSRFVQLSGGDFALIDPADWPLVAGHSWRAAGSIERRHGLYAVADIDGQTVYMHRLLMAAAPGETVDHINGDGLDNRRSVNLRLCTPQQNQMNKRRRTDRRFKGPTARGSRWEAHITVDGRSRFLGGFRSEIQAARAYDAAARQHFGEFANLNFSPERDWLFPHEHAGQWPPKRSGDVGSEGDR